MLLLLSRMLSSLAMTLFPTTMSSLLIRSIIITLIVLSIKIPLRLCLGQQKPSLETLKFLLRAVFWMSIYLLSGKD